MTTETGPVVGPADWIDNEGLRMAVALERIALSTERIAIALEQAALERLTPIPPASHGVPSELPPPPQAATPVARPIFRVGDVHTQGHNPIRESNKGQYCPTKMPDGTWCQWSAPK
jgi:hypothetical protein